MKEDKYSLSELKRAYNKALKENKEQFDFHGKIFLCKFAKYLIQYLEGKYKQQGLRETEKTIVFTSTKSESSGGCGLYSMNKR